jgi:hypothetical protein
MFGRCVLSIDGVCDLVTLHVWRTADTGSGQVKILEKAMETIEERIERVERVTAEGQGCSCCN